MKHLGKLLLNKPDWKRDRTLRTQKTRSHLLFTSPKPPLIIQNGQPIALLTKNQRLQGGVDPDVFFNQVCGR